MLPASLRATWNRKVEIAAGKSFSGCWGPRLFIYLFLLPISKDGPLGKVCLLNVTFTLKRCRRTAKKIFVSAVSWDVASDEAILRDYRLTLVYPDVASNRAAPTDCCEILALNVSLGVTSTRSNTHWLLRNPFLNRLSGHTLRTGTNGLLRNLFPNGLTGQLRNLCLNGLTGHQLYTKRYRRAAREETLPTAVSLTQTAE